MCVTKPTAMLIKAPPKTFSDVFNQVEEGVFITGGRGNAKLLSWYNGNHKPPINLIKEFNHNHSYNICPRTIRRKGRIIRYMQQR